MHGPISLPNAPYRAGGTMKTRILLALTLFAAALPAVAAPSCLGGQTLQGSVCVVPATLGWVVGGPGNVSAVNLYVPPNASGPVDFEVTAVSSSLGSTYTGYFGIVGGQPGQP